MKPLLTLVTAITLIALLTLPAQNEERIVVATSIPPLALIVKDIGGDYVDVFYVLPPGAEPHHFQLTPDLLDKLKGADLFVHTGHFEFEFRIVEALNIKSIGRKDFEKHGLRLMPYPASLDINPHGYWLYPDNAIAIAKAIERVLESLDPEHAEYYRDRLSKFINEVEEFKEFARRLIQARGYHEIGIILTVPGEEYFVKALGLEIKGLIAKDGILPGAKELAELEDMLRSECLVITLAEIASGVKAGEYAHELAGETHTPIARLCIVHTEDFPSFLSLLYYNLGSLASALSQASLKRVGMEVELYVPIELYHAAIIILAIVAIAELLLIIRLTRR